MVFRSGSCFSAHSVSRFGELVFGKSQWIQEYTFLRAPVTFQAIRPVRICSKDAECVARDLTESSSSLTSAGRAC